MNLPNPALVSQQAAQRLPRWVLLLFCAAYVLPGLFGRDPWKNADLSAVGYMLALARSQADWLSPALGGLPADGGLLPYWLGAISIRMFDGLIDAPLAARLPFALLLAGTIACVWYGCYHLARTDRAQPLAFAFGGEADPIDQPGQERAGQALQGGLPVVGRAEVECGQPQRISAFRRQVHDETLVPQQGKQVVDGRSG